MKLTTKLLDALKGNKEENEILEKVEILASEDNVELTKKKAEIRRLERDYNNILWSDKSAATAVKAKLDLEVAKKQLAALEEIIKERYED